MPMGCLQSLLAGYWIDQQPLGGGHDLSNAWKKVILNMSQIRVDILSWG